MRDTPLDADGLGNKQFVSSKALQASAAIFGCQATRTVCHEMLFYLVDRHSMPSIALMLHIRPPFPIICQFTLHTIQRQLSTADRESDLRDDTLLIGQQFFRQRILHLALNKAAHIAGTELD